MQESAHVSVVQWKKSNSKGGGIFYVFFVFLFQCVPVCVYRLHFRDWMQLYLEI